MYKFICRVFLIVNLIECTSVQSMHIRAVVEILMSTRSA